MAAQHYANKQCYSLLVRVKNTVESLLSSDHCNIFSTYGGLKRLSDNIQDLFQHQLQVGGGNFWPVIQQLCKASLIELNTGKAQHDKIEAQECPSRIWLEFSLSNHCLSKSIYELSLHQTELCLFYAEGAFLRSNFCREALQRCLEAVERSDPAILAEVNPAQLRKQLENVNNLSTPNLSFHSSQETFPTSSQFSFLSSSQPVQSGSLYMRRSFSYDNGHQIANSNLKRHQSQPQNSSILDETDPSLNSTTLDNSSDKGKECRQRKRSVFNRPQELSGLSSSIQQSYTIAEEENEVDVPLPDGILKARSKSQPWNIYNLSQDTCSNNGRNRVINFHRSLTPNQADAYTPLSASVSTGLDEDSSLPGSLESQLMRLLSTKSNDEENDNNNYNQLPVNLSNYHAIDPLTSGDPLQAVQHDSTPIKVTKITTSNNQRKLHELTKVGNFTNPIHSNRTENKRKLFTSGSSSDETNLDDIFSPTFENNASDRSQFQFNVKVTSDKLLPHKDIVARSPVLQSSNIAFENTDDLTSQDKTSRELNINSEISPKQKKGKNRKISISSQQPSNPVDRELSDIVRDIAMLSDIASTEELERENAHISLAESVITHIEAIRCQKILEPLDCTFNEEVEDESSGDEVSQLGKNDSADVISNSWEDLSNVNESTVNSTIDELKVSRSNTLTQKKSYDSYSQYIQTESKESGNDTNSAEYLARSLLASVAKQYSDKPAADTNLLISDTEVPQELLPNPVLSSESATNSTLTESMEQSTPRIRGNLEWAPPRQQIIFIIHPQTKRKTVIAQANYRCAGCGMKVDKGYSKRFRYCEYFGKYFCHTCHGNATAIIPGHVIQKWDFTKFPVSNMARELLTKMHHDPLFNVMDINQSLYKKKTLNTVKELRIQLFHLKKYISTCGSSKGLLERLEKLPLHIIDQPHVYSMHDFMSVKKKELNAILEPYVIANAAHISQCQLCRLKGFICEICKSETLIYPFEILTCYQCDDCHTCYHKRCKATLDSCPKCARIKRRKQQAAAID